MSARRVLIVDDEPLGRQRVEDLVRADPELEIVGTAATGPAAVEAIRTLAPDLLFLDIQMPGMTGLEVARTIGAEAMPVTIFVTAYDQHALRAFELAALDYLVKPYDDERFEQSVARAKELLRLREGGLLRERMLALLGAPGAGGEPGAVGAAPAPAASERPRYLERIAVEMKGKIRVVPVPEIDYILASGPYAELTVGDRRFIIRESMNSLEDRLDPGRFMRVHRSVIVQLDRVDALLKAAGGDYDVQLRGGAKLRVSRSRREALERRLGVVE